jgi:hypothetical protein
MSLATDAFVDRLLVRLPSLQAEYETIRRESAEEGLGEHVAGVFLDEVTRALRYRFRSGVIEATAELAALAAVLEEEYGRDPEVDQLVEGCFLSLLSVEDPGGPDPITVLGPELAAVVRARREWRADPAASAFVERLVAAVPALSRLAVENRSGDRGDVLVHGFLSDVAFREADNFRSQDPAALEEVRAVLAALEAEFGVDRGVDEAIAVSFVENLPYPGDPGADLVQELGPKLRTELESQRPPEA